MKTINFNIDKFKILKNAKYGNIGNKLLYDLCKNYPNHNVSDEIYAKIWLIGRSYAASIERRNKKNKKHINDDFYDYVIKKFIKFNINNKFDSKLNQLKNKKFNKETLKEIIKIHSELTKFFHKLTGKEKRSLASKYLHFHVPIFPIYDSRANNSVNKIVKGKTPKSKGDKQYSKFCDKILFLFNHIKDKTGKTPSLREIDTYLLEFANDNLRRKKGSNKK